MTDWDARFLDLANHVAQWSKDPSTKVGCIITDDNKIIAGVGYNGFPRGVNDTPARLNDRATKYLMVQHAEVNAILNSTKSLRGATAFVTHAPCANCTGALIQAGIVRIVAPETNPGLRTRFAESFRASVEMMREAGVEFVEKETEV